VEEEVSSYVREKIGHCKLKEESIDRVLLRTHSERNCGLSVRQAVEWIPTVTFLQMHFLPKHVANL
jgi:hypothetical protein